MENHLKAKVEFNQKLDNLEKKFQPALYRQDLKELVIYEKLLEIQNQIALLNDRIKGK